MTIVNASAATEAVNISLVSDQFAFDAQDPAGDNGATEYSWLTPGGDDVQAFGTSMDFLNDPPTSGQATRIEFDLSNNNFQNPDVVISSITAPVAGGARMDILSDGALQVPQ